MFKAVLIALALCGSLIALTPATAFQVRPLDHSMAMHSSAILTPASYHKHRCFRLYRPRRACKGQAALDGKCRTTD